MIAKLFISLLRLSPWLQRALWRWWYQRLAKRATDSGWTFMNYGYSSLNDNSSIDLKTEDESDRLFIQLYNYASSQIPLENRKVLEVGSLDINGTVRIFFDNCDYTGLDLGEGKGVDLIEEGQNYDAPDETYDTVLSTECFEHNPYWKETFLNMIRLCKKNGLVFFTCAIQNEFAKINRPEINVFFIFHFSIVSSKILICFS